ncbi:MAG TPA: ornithine cyclodeaminase family protein [Anaerolineae bacterium]|nr:ornithine cyclodeaminase family protein [Anaerolineae bacterium]
MQVLIINQTQVATLLPMNECIAVMEDTFAALARGQAILPLRPIMWLPEKVGALGMMPSYLANIQRLGVKVITVMPGNHGTPYDSHQGVVLLFEEKHGQLLAIIDATSITAIRTAAVSGIATQLLARQDADDLAILGSGTQARTHLDAMLCVRPIRRVRVWSRHEENARAFAERESKRHNIPIKVMPTAQTAVQDADLICTTTSAIEPILFGEWIAPGAHINAVGSSVAHARELDTNAMLKSKLFVDRRESTVNEAGDFLFPKKEGALGADHIRGELGELLIGQIHGRTSPDEITLFKSLGLAIEDLAAAQHIYTKALEKGIGLSVELGGGRDETA